MFKSLKYSVRKTIFQKVDTPFYDPKTAIRLIQSQYLTFHRESLEFNIKLGIDLKRSDQNVRGSINIPLGKKRVLYFIGSPEQNQIAIKSKVDKIVNDSIFNKWDKDIIEFDTLFATAEGIKLLKPYARFLGPKGLFPNLKIKTLIAEKDIETSIRKARQGKLDIQNNEDGKLSGQLGKLQFYRSTLFQNYNDLLNFIISKRPKDLKSKYIKEISLNSSRGKKYLIDLTSGVPQNNNYVFNDLNNKYSQLIFQIQIILNNMIVYILTQSLNQINNGKFYGR